MIKIKNAKEKEELALKEKEKNVFPSPEDDEKFKSFFEVDDKDLWDETLEEKEVREKIKEHKVKSMKERKRSGEDSGPKRSHHRR